MYAQFKFTKVNVMYPSIITSSGSCSTPSGVHEQVRTDRLPNSHKESTASSGKLEYTDTGQMGPANSTRVYDRFHPDTSSVPSTPSNNDITRQSCSGDTGSARANPEGGNNRDYCLIRQLCLPDIPGREKGRGAMPSYQPEGTESVCPGRTLQDGGITPSSRPNPTGGLDDKNGPKRCLSSSASPRGSSVLPPICLGREALQVSVPSIWSVISAKSVYEATETSGGPPETDGLAPDNLPGDILFMHSNRDQLEEMAPLIVSLFEALGLMVNRPKSLLTPTQSIEFLGFLINSHIQKLFLPLEKSRKILQEAAKLLRQQTLTARELAMFIGKVTATSRALWQAPLHYRALQRALNSVIAGNDSQELSDRYKIQVLMNDEMKKDLQWWTTLDLWNVGTPICSTSTPALVLESDASQKGWGARCMETSTGGCWSTMEAQYHINYLELLAAFLALKTFANDQKGLILLRMDNVSAVTYINQKGVHTQRNCAI